MRQSVETLERLLGHAEHLGDDVTANIRASVIKVRAKLEKNELNVVVVGEKRAGKTTFLNALLGERVLPKTVRELVAVIHVKRRARETYVARLDSGEIIDFEDLHPDESIALSTRIDACKAEIASVTAERDAASEVLARQREMRDQAQGELKGKFEAFERARTEAERLGTEIAEAETEKARAKELVQEREQALPKVLQARPPVWAVWLWMAYAVALLFSLAAWRAWKAAIGELAAVRGKTARLQVAASEAALQVRQAESALDPVASPAQSAHADFASARRRLTEIDARLRDLQRGCDVLGAELEQYRSRRRAVFYLELAELCDPNRRGNEVDDLEIAHPARHLPDDVTLICVPALTADSYEAQERAWDIIEQTADGCILVSELERAVTGATKTFLQRAREIVPHVLLVLTKMDASFVEAARRKAGEPWEHVEQARRIATRRFAREIGRDASSVLSVSISAKAALDEEQTAGLARRFETETDKLFQLLRQERALILGARTGAEIRRCIDGAADAQKRAERRYQERLAVLEDRKRPEPEQFRSEQVAAAQPLIYEASAQITNEARALLRAGIAKVRALVKQRIEACGSGKELIAAVPEFEQLARDGVARIESDLRRHVDLAADDAVKRIEQGAFEALRLRYEIASLVSRASSPSLHLADTSEASPAITPDLTGGVTDAVRSFRTFRVGFGIGGTTAGALAGTAILPGIGTAIGAAVGALVTFARTFGSLERECAAYVERFLQEREATIDAQIVASEAALAHTISEGLDDSIARAIRRFDQWILEPLEADRAAISEQRERLEDLEQLRARLIELNRQLGDMMRVALESSLGLCR